MKNPIRAWVAKIVREEVQEMRRESNMKAMQDQINESVKRRAYFGVRVDQVSTDDRARNVIRDLPESFWDAAAWEKGDLLSTSATLDVADRLRITRGILNAHEDGES